MTKIPSAQAPKVSAQRPEYSRYDPRGEQNAFGVQTLSRDDALASA